MAVDVVFDGEEALARTDYDVVVLDRDLPAMRLEAAEAPASVATNRPRH